MTKQILTMDLILSGDPAGSADSSKAPYCVNDSVEIDLRNCGEVSSDTVWTWAQAVQAVKDAEGIS